MKKRYTLHFIIIVANTVLLLNTNLFSQCLQYLGQTPPGNNPVRLVPDSLAANSAWQYHGTPTFSPDGKEMYYAIYRHNPGRVEIWFTECVDGNWTTSKKAPFSNDNYENNNPIFSQHRDTLYFFSSRPGGFIFRVTRTNEIWSVPVALNLQIPSGYSTGLQFSIADNRNIYAELGNQGNADDIYIWRYVNNQYQTPEKLTAICSPELDFTPFIDPQERFIMFASRRTGGFSNTDIYISKRNPDNTWASPINLGQEINSGDVISPIISRDGKYFFFEAWIPGALGGNPYWMDADFINGIISDSTIIDADGNVYHPIKIGSQIWLVENLKTTKYRNGDLIPNVSLNSAWANLSTGAYCNYNNNSSNSETYGRLYNWFAVNDSRGLAPEGWHIATDEDWTILTDLLGGESVAGGKLKEVGTAHWGNPNNGATNEVGFTALPGGYRANFEAFIGLNSIGSWWTSTASSATEGWARGIFNEAVNVDRGGYYEKKMGFSVRCVKDDSTTEVIEKEELPNKFGLFQNYPNPFNPSTKISWNAPVASIQTLKIYDVLGKEISTVVDEFREAGRYEIEFDASIISSGIYFYSLQAGGYLQMRKMILLK
jgi:uncharacterized protein (TIGR02145 family)